VPLAATDTAGCACLAPYGSTPGTPRGCRLWCFATRSCRLSCAPAGGRTPDTCRRSVLRLWPRSANSPSCLTLCSRPQSERPPYEGAAPPLAGSVGRKHGGVLAAWVRFVVRNPLPPRYVLASGRLSPFPHGRLPGPPLIPRLAVRTSPSSLRRSAWEWSCLSRHASGSRQRRASARSARLFSRWRRAGLPPPPKQAPQPLYRAVLQTRPAGTASTDAGPCPSSSTSRPSSTRSGCAAAESSSVRSSPSTTNLAWPRARNQRPMGGSPEPQVKGHPSWFAFFASNICCT
jgi:hypothetical protein